MSKSQGDVIALKTLKQNTAILQPRVARWPVFRRPGRYFTANLAEAGKRPVF